MKLSPIKSVGPYRIVASSSVQGEQVEAVLQNVLFGDVWLCSGQSNMEFTVGMVGAIQSTYFAFSIQKFYPCTIELDLLDIDIDSNYPNETVWFTSDDQNDYYRSDLECTIKAVKLTLSPRLTRLTGHSWEQL